ncbi:MAG TPA: hypothetical protein VKV39_20590 [Candidatus Sulfotelmatobacter sp.]|nr:hypothetical protein [Candidatus Sulfotelmatobacter sp.]
MKTLLRVIFGLLVMLATLLLSNCSPYGCKVTFGSSTCTPSGGSGFGGSGSGGGGGGGGGNGTTAAFVYAADQAGTVDGLELTTNASTLTSIPSYTPPTIPTNTGGVGMVVAQKTYLYVGIAGTFQIYGYAIGSAGTLSTISGSPFTATYLANYIGGVGQANMITNPAGTFLFISDATGNSIHVLQIGSTGGLTEIGGSPFACPAGFSSPMNLATDGLGKYLYVVSGNYSNHQGSQVAAFSIGSSGALAAVPGSPFAYKMWQLAGEPTGQFLVGTSGSTAYYSGVTDDDNLYVFSINQTNGAPTLLGKIPTVNSPFSIAMQSNSGGNLVYAFGFNDTATAFNPIEGFSLSSTGQLSQTTGEPYSFGEGSWGQFDQSGAWLFVYASFFNSSTNTFTTQMTPLAVGTGGSLSQPVATGSLQTPGFWVVTDPQ